MRTAELELAAEPDAVPRARRFVRYALETDHPDVVADAELVASELVTNALLHGRPPVVVRVRVDGPVRLEIEDAGHSAPILVQRIPDAMTGRGLAMVAALSSRWGVDASTSGGKVVWAELSREAPPVPPQPQIDIDELLASWADDGLEPELVTVRLGPVPTELLLAAKAHMDNVARELALMGDGRDVPADIAELIRSAMLDFAEARSAIKRQAAVAAAAGEANTHLELRLPTAAAAAAERYLAALDEADRWARSAHLLTLAPPAAHRLLRDWYVGAIVDTLRATTSGAPPPPPRPFGLVLAERLTELADQAEASARLALLQAITRDLAAASTVEEMARIVVERAVGFLGVRTARVRLLTDGVLRSMAWRGVPGVPEPAEHPDIPVDSDLPGAEVFRSGRLRYLRSVAGSLHGHPDLSSAFASETSGYLVPLRVGDHRLGLLSLSFTEGELASETEQAIVEAIADVAAQALRRAELSRRDEQQRETLAFLADATEILITAREPSEVLDRLVTLAVPRLGDWCTVYLAEGDRLRRVAMAIEGFSEFVPQLLESTLPIDVDVPQTRALRSGRPVPIEDRVGELLQVVYPDLDRIGVAGALQGTTGLCVPIVLRGRSLGVVALTFVASGRRVTPSTVEALTGLSARAAIAFDNAGNWSAQRQLVQSLVATLLPPDPPVVAGLSIASRYLPAAGDVAGDWWEAQVMPDGTVLIGLGDAAGHGLDAVSQMSQLRHGARALAALDASPAALLSDLNQRLVEPDSGFATAVYGRLDPVAGRLRWASAGHVPPIVSRAGGRVEILEGSSGAPLGAPRGGPPADLELTLGTGDTLVFYSDGVIERRHIDLGEGIEALRATVAAHHAARLDELADRILAVHCSERVDDCCLLLVRREA